MQFGACTLKENKGTTKCPQNQCLCMGKGLVRGCGGGMGAHRPCSSSRKLNENKKDTPSPTQSPKCRYVLVQGLRGMAHQPFSPRQDTTGFLGPIAEAKWQLPLPSLPRIGDGNGHHLSRPCQGKPPMPRNKKHNQTNGKKKPKTKPQIKNQKHCYHQLI